MARKTKSGEDYTDVYQTSFDVGVFTSDGHKMVRARVSVPPSETMFYTCIYKQMKKKRISDMAHLSAEIHCFQRGYRIVA